MIETLAATAGLVFALGIVARAATNRAFDPVRESSRRPVAR